MPITLTLLLEQHILFSIYNMITHFDDIYKYSLQNSPDLPFFSIPATGISNPSADLAKKAFFLLCFFPYLSDQSIITSYLRCF
jgi:hypothetical protein